MSTDSTELTFVRCPSCRSLVPAMSTRCRMCGATLDAQGKQAEDPDKDKKSSRVRQRTMSSTGTNELSSAVSQLREQLEGAPANGSADQIASDDPLGPYIEEVQSTEQRAEVGKLQPALQTGEIQLIQPLDVAPSTGLQGGFDSIPAVPISSPRPEAVIMKSSEAAAAADGLDAGIGIEEGEKPRVIIESGGRRFGKPSGLSFGRKEEGAPEDRAAQEERRAEPSVRIREEPVIAAKNVDRNFGDRPQPKRIDVQDAPPRTDTPRNDPPRQEQAPAGGAPGHQTPRGNNDQRHADGQRPGNKPEQRNNDRRREEPREENRREGRRDEPRSDRQEARRDEGRHEARREESKPEQRREDRPRQDERSRQTPPPPARDMKIAASRPRDGAGAKKVESEPGRLCGWLVSYSDPQGAAVELREGKFFVSRSSLKPTDLIVEEESISTPHALITVIGGSALQVQDLMSERGVFVRRRGGDTYQRIEENVAAEHGDWLRFGDVEFLVSMIAQVGATGE